MHATAMEHVVEDISLSHAKEHLEELIARARQGEAIRIRDDKLGVVRLTPEESFVSGAPRVTDTLPPFVPLSEDRKLGRLEGILPKLPDEFFDPLSEEDLKEWYGDDA